MEPKRIGNQVMELLNRPWFVYGLLFLITLLAAVLRFYKLGEWSLWIDEIYTINHAVNHFSTPQLLVEHLPPNRNWVPVSVILTAQVFNLFGLNEFNARLVAAALGILTVPVLYFPLRKIFNTRVALLTVLLLAVAPWHIDWSQNARGYTSLMLFYSLALFSFYFGIEKDRPVYLLLFFLFIYLSSSERMIALFILPVMGVYLLAAKFMPVNKPAGWRARNIFILLAPALLLIPLEAYGYVRNGESVITSILDEIVITFLGKPIEGAFTQAIFMIFKLGIPLVVLSIFMAAYLLLQRNRQGLFFSIAALVPFALVIAITPLFFTEERYAFVTLPSWLVLAAIGIDGLLSRPGKFEFVFAAGVLTMLLADAMGANLLYFRANQGNRWDYRQAFGIVDANVQEGDMIVTTFPEIGNYYLERQDVVAWDEMNVESIKNSGQRVWFVVIPDMTWYTGTQDFYWWMQRYTRMIKTLYLRTVDNTNLEIYLYDPAVYPEMVPLKDPEQ